MDFFTGQILPLAFGYAPKQTALCAGQSIPINQNQALYALLGTAYGGTGANFALPDTTGRAIFGIGNQGSAMPLGSTGGEAQHQLSPAEMPQHVHPLMGSTTGTTDPAPDGYLPGVPTSAIYGAAAALLPLGGAPMGNAGGGQPHQNMQPSLALNFAIVLYGIYPSRR